MRNAVSRRFTLAAGLSLLVASRLGVGKAADAVAPNQVTIDDFAFAPKILTVAPGTEVTWINKDVEPHTVVYSGEEKLFRSPALDTDDKFSFVFKTAGTYPYYCSVHPHMTGTIVVK